MEYIARALFHLGQRRGFKSNRKTDRLSNEKGKIAVGIEKLRGEMRKKSASTLGEYLACQRAEGKTVRIRANSVAFQDGSDDYVFYPERAMLEDEFRQIWQKQSTYYPEELTEGRGKHLFDIIFYQRALKKAVVGRCTFNTDEDRLAKADPLFQEFRLYKEINELGVVLADLKQRKLTLEERDTLVQFLRPKKTVKFKTLKKTLKLKVNESFNKESESRSHLVGNEVYATLRGKQLFGDMWASFPLEEQREIVDKIINEQSPEKLQAWLKERYHVLGSEQRDEIVEVDLPAGYGKLGYTAVTKILERLKAEVIPESEALRLCGYNSDLLGRGEEEKDLLPRYQEVLERHIATGTGNPDDIYDVRKGRINNPTVHIGLNQLRRLTNCLLTQYGKPRKIVVELARDLQLSDKKKETVNKTIRENKKAAEERSEKLQEIGQKDNGYNRLLLKLWEELAEDPVNRVCVYTGAPISAAMLFSGDVDIDHILPWSKTLDDSQANKIICLKHANRVKGNRAPSEVTEWQENYDEILQRAKRLPKNKQWRFAKNAMQKVGEQQDFLARQLTDTQYVSRMACQYLNALYPKEEANSDGELKKRNHVWAVPGRLTELLRRNWGLNGLLQEQTGETLDKPKNRQDHRHHAIDAVVIGVTNRALLQRMSSAAKKLEENAFEDFVKKAVSNTLPWKDFRENLEQNLKKIIVSHKQDHGTISRCGYKTGKGQTAGKLHDATAYGITNEKDQKGNDLVVFRKSFLTIEAKQIKTIRDQKLREEVERAVSGLGGKEYQKALFDFSQNHKAYKGIRRVRTIKPLKVVPIKDKHGKIFKGYKEGSNYRYDVWETRDNKWHSEVVSMFKAHQPGWKSAFHKKYPTARKVLTLHKNDMVAYVHPDNGYTVARVVKTDQNGNILFAPHHEANVASRNTNKNDSFKLFSKRANGLKDIQCRQVRVSEIGKMFDPGPQDKVSKKM